MATAPRTPEQNVTASEALTELTKQRMSLHAALKADAIYQNIPVSNRTVFCAYDRLVRALSGATQITIERQKDCKTLADWLAPFEGGGRRLACEIDSFIGLWVQTCTDIVEGKIGQPAPKVEADKVDPREWSGWSSEINLTEGKVMRSTPVATDSVSKIIINASIPPTINFPVVRACAMRWAKGRETRGLAFEGDPIEELYEELIDAINYCDEAEVQGTSFAEEREMLWTIANKVRAKREKELDDDHCAFCATH